MANPQHSYMVKMYPSSAALPPNASAWFESKGNSQASCGDSLLCLAQKWESQNGISDIWTPGDLLVRGWIIVGKNETCWASEIHPLKK